MCNFWYNLQLVEGGWYLVEMEILSFFVFIPCPPLTKGGGGYTVLPLSVLPSVQDIFRRIFLSNYSWQKSDIWSQASYRYPISWEAFFDPSDSYFLFTEEQGYHKWALAHSSSCLELISDCMATPYVECENQSSKGVFKKWTSRMLYYNNINKKYTNI
jgi:hypothetical protein